MCTKHARKVEFMDNLWNGVSPEAFLAEVASSSPSVAPLAPSVGGGAASRHVRSHHSAAGVFVRGVSPVSNSGGDADSEGGSDGDNDSDDSEDTETIESEIRETRVLLDKLVEQRRTLFALLGTSSSSSSSGAGDSTTDVGTDETLLVALADAATLTSAAPVSAVDAMNAMNEKLSIESHNASKLSRNRAVSTDMLNCLSVLEPCLTSGPGPGPGPGLDATPACCSVDAMSQIRSCLQEELVLAAGLGLPLATATAIATVTTTSAKRVRAREGETQTPLTLAQALGVGEGESPRKRAGGLGSCLRFPSPTPSSF